MIAHVTWRLSRSGGGIPEVVFPLAWAQTALDRDVVVFGVRDGQPTARPSSVPVYESAVTGPIALGYAPDMLGALERAAPEVVHLHGLFTWPSVIVRKWARRSRRPTIVAPHGMLEPWALANSAWKKRIFRAAVEDGNIRGAACVHALCAQEARNIRALGFETPIAVVPNGVDLPKEGQGDPVAFTSAYPAASGRGIVLFLGRIHPKKGLFHLLSAWAAVKRDRPALGDWILVVAGPDQLGHTAEIARRASELDLARDVLFTGPLYGRSKDNALSAASGFVLSSFSEGLPMAVLDAMAWRLPVLVTRQCNIDVETFGGGILADPEAESVAGQLRAFIDLTDAERRAMGERGRREVEARYTWARVARDILDTYRWVLGDNHRPDFVEAPR